MRQFALILFMILDFATAETRVASVAGARPGYLASVARERELLEVEMVLVPPPPPPEIKSRPLVDAKLTKEFQIQYETRFGRTEAERNYNTSNRFAFYEYPGGKIETMEAHEDRERQFGEYMMRRLTEYHVDLYAKSNPDIRPVYELKDRIANVDVRVRRNYKIKFKYSYSGNFLDVRLENPYDFTTKVTFHMGGGIGPGAVERTIYTVSYPVTKEATIAVFEEVDRASATSVVGSYRLTKSLSTTLTAAHDVPVDRDIWESSPRQNLILLGLSWTE